MDKNDLAEAQPPFGRWLGMKITHAAPDRVVAELTVREELANRNGVLHGGAVMALADNMGGTATFLNLPRAPAPPRSRARPTSSPPARSARPSRPRRRPCTAAAPPWCGRRGSPAP